MTRYFKIRPNTGRRTVLTCLLITIILICIYTGIFHLHGYNSHIYIPPILTTGILCSLHVDDLMKIKLATKDPEIIEVLKVYKK